MKKAYIFIADLHIGGLTDFKALEATLREVRKYLDRVAPERRILLVLGDIVEGAQIHRYQHYVFHPMQQPFYAALVLNHIATTINADRTIVIPGNHDYRVHEGKNMLTMMIEKARELGLNIEVKKEGVVIYVGKKKVLLRHELGYSSGSYAGGTTPKLRVNALVYLREMNVDMLIAGHYHVFGMTPELILLPSFQWSSDPKYWTRGCVIMFDNGIITPIIMQNKTDYNNEEVLEELEDWFHYLKRKYKNGGGTVKICREFDGYMKTRQIPEYQYWRAKELIERGLPLNEVARRLGLYRSDVRLVKYGRLC